MTVAEMIEKYSLRMMSDGETVYSPILKKLSANELADLKAAKPEIVAELNRRTTEKAAAEAAARAKKVEEQRPLRQLALVYSGHYMMNREVAYVVPTGDGRYVLAIESESIEVPVKTLNSDAVETVTSRNVDGVLPVESRVWLLTDEEADAIIAAANAETQAEADEAAAKEEAAEAVRSEKFAQAAETGQPVELARGMIECDVSATECSMDLVIEYAMPDGTVSEKRTHTH